MIQRRLLPTVLRRLQDTPAVVLLGPRQAGKTTLALTVAEAMEAVYLDLESEQDRAKLAEAERYLPTLFGRLVILDEVRRAPGLFPVLRGLIDRARREGHREGLYLLLGSASLDLLRQSGESLAGRVSFLELGPFDLLEVKDAGAPDPESRLWLRGGFPESFLAPDDARSFRWRLDFVRTYLERDVPQFGRRIPAETLRRFWAMLAHLQGSPLNASELARSLGVSSKTASAYVDLLADLLLVRRLPPWHANIRKRLAKSPKVYVRDSGLVHALLGIRDLDALLAHPIAGRSWEGFVVENLLAVAPEGVEGFYYRTAGGAEIDLLLRFPEGALWAVEVKRNLTPKPARGFYSACADLQPARRFVVYPGNEPYPLSEDVWAVPLAFLAQELAGQAGGV
ncbi:ATP-binding protein [Deferrisoma sp.]